MSVTTPVPKEKLPKTYIHAARTEDRQQQTNLPSRSRRTWKKAFGNCFMYYVNILDGTHHNKDKPFYGKRWGIKFRIALEYNLVCTHRLLRRVVQEPIETSQGPISAWRNTKLFSIPRTPWATSFYSWLCKHQHKIPEERKDNSIHLQTRIVKQLSEAEGQSCDTMFTSVELFHVRLDNGTNNSLCSKGRFDQINTAQIAQETLTPKVICICYRKEVQFMLTASENMTILSESWRKH